MPQRAHYLGQLGFFNLNSACAAIRRAYGPCIYLVGSSLDRPDFRDVDVRAILDDTDFDRMFPHASHKDAAGAIQRCPHRDAQFNLVCATFSEWLRVRTGLPVDFQFQRMTDANAEFAGPRNAIGINFDVPICSVKGEQ